MVLVRVDNCAKYAALHDISDRSWHQEPSHIGGREAMLRSQQLGGNTTDNPKSKAKARKKTIFSAPASINVETERRKRKILVWQMIPGPTPCPAATLQVPISEHLRCQQNRHKAESNLKTNLCTAGETLSTHGELRLGSVLLPKDEVFQVKSLNGCGICRSASPHCSADRTAMRAARRSRTF